MAAGAPAGVGPAGVGFDLARWRRLAGHRRRGVRVGPGHDPHLDGGGAGVVAHQELGRTRLGGDRPAGDLHRVAVGVGPGRHLQHGGEVEGRGRAVGPGGGVAVGQGAAGGVEGGGLGGAVGGGGVGAGQGGDHRRVHVVAGGRQGRVDDHVLVAGPERPRHQAGVEGPGEALDGRLVVGGTELRGHQRIGLVTGGDGEVDGGLVVLGGGGVDVERQARLLAREAGDRGLGLPEVEQGEGLGEDQAVGIDGVDGGLHPGRERGQQGPFLVGAPRGQAAGPVGPGPRLVHEVVAHHCGGVGHRRRHRGQGLGVVLLEGDPVGPGPVGPESNARWRAGFSM